MLDVISEGRHTFKIKVNDYFLDKLLKHSLFQVRTSSDAEEKIKKVRWGRGSIVICHKQANLEPYSVIGAGNNIYSLGAFGDVVSELPLAAKVGRYASIAKRVEILGFRHPIEAAVMSCVSFRKPREIMRSYARDFEASHGRSMPFSPTPTPQPDQTLEIGHDVWIGQDVSIGLGLKIGNGAVIAANTVVTKDVPSYAVVGGIPAKVIKYRFSNEVIALLEHSRWWSYAPSDLHLFDMSNPEKFALEIIESRRDLNEFNPESINFWDIYTSSK